MNLEESIVHSPTFVTGFVLWIVILTLGAGRANSKHEAINATVIRLKFLCAANIVFIVALILNLPSSVLWLHNLPILFGSTNSPQLRQMEASQSARFDEVLFWLLFICIPFFLGMYSLTKAMLHESRRSHAEE